YGGRDENDPRMAQGLDGLRLQGGWNPCWLRLPSIIIPDERQAWHHDKILLLHAVLGDLEHDHDYQSYGSIRRNPYRTVCGVFFAVGCSAGNGIRTSRYETYPQDSKASYSISFISTDVLKPWLAGIFAGTLFFVGIRWLTTILP